MDIVAYLDDENKYQVTNENLTSGIEHECEVHRIPPDFPSHPTKERKPRFVEWTQIEMESAVEESVICGADSIDLLALADTFDEIIPNNQMAKYIKSTYEGESLHSLDTDESTLDTFHTADSSSYLPNLSQLTNPFDDSSTIDSAFEHEGIDKKIAHDVTFDESTVDSTIDSTADSTTDSTLEHEREEGSDTDIGPDDTFDDLTAKSTLEDEFESESETEIDRDSTFDDRTSDSTLELKTAFASTFDDLTAENTEVEMTFDDFTAYSTIDFDDDDGCETEIDCDSIFDDCTIETVEDFNDQYIVLEIAKEDLPLYLEGFKYDEQRSDIAVIAEDIKPTEQVLNTPNTASLVSMVSLRFLPWLGGGKTNSTSVQIESVKDNDDASTTIEHIADGENDSLSKNSEVNGKTTEKICDAVDGEDNGRENSNTIIGVKEGEEIKDSLPANLDERKARGEEKPEESTTLEHSRHPCIEVERNIKEKATAVDQEEDVMEGREHRWEDMKAILKKTARIERREKLKKSIKGAFKSLRFRKRKDPFYVDDEGEYDLVVTVMD